MNLVNILSGKRFEEVGVENTTENRRKYRQMVRLFVFIVVLFLHFAC